MINIIVTLQEGEIDGRRSIDISTKFDYLDDDVSEQEAMWAVYIDRTIKAGIKLTGNPIHNRVTGEIEPGLSDKDLLGDYNCN